MYVSLTEVYTATAFFEDLVEDQLRSLLDIQLTKSDNCINQIAEQCASHSLWKNCHQKLYISNSYHFIQFCCSFTILRNGVVVDVY